MEATANQIGVVIDHLRNSNAAEELMIDSIDSGVRAVSSQQFDSVIADIPSVLEIMSNKLDKLISLFSDSFTYTKKQDELEQRESRERELEENDKDSGDASLSFSDVFNTSARGGIMGLVGNIIATLSLFLGFITGWFDKLTKVINSTKVGKLINDFFSKVFSVKGISQSPSVVYVKKLISDVTNIVRNFITSYFDKIKNAISSLSKNKAIAGAINTIRGIARPIGVAFGLISSSVLSFSPLISSIGNFFSNIAPIFKKITGAFKVGLKLGARLFAPINVLIGLFGAIKGSIEGFAKTDGNIFQKIIGGLKGGIKGAFKALFGDLLNLIKTGFSKLASYFGLDWIATALDSFDFNEIFSVILDKFFLGWDLIVNTVTGFLSGWKDDGLSGAITGAISGFWNTIKDFITKIANIFGFGDEVKKIFSGAEDMLKQGISLIKDGFIKVVEDSMNFIKSIPDTISDQVNDILESISNFGEMSEVFIKKILQNVLPKPDPSAPWYSVKSLASSAIPDSVYEYAGINPKTGKMKEIKTPVLKIEPSSTTTKSDIINKAGDTSTNNTVIVNNVRGGNTVNTNNSSNVNNTNSAAGPIITGSAMGFANY
jgi:hypothetical protein